MELDQAVKILTDVCARLVGNLQDHNIAQTALKTVKDRLVEPKAEGQAQ